MGITMKCYGGAPGNRGASLFPEGRTYSPPAKAGGGSPPVGQARALSEGDCVSCGSRRTMPQPGWFCCHRPCSYRKHTRFCVCEQGYSLYPCLAPTACENLPPAALSQIWVSLLQRHPFSLLPLGLTKPLVLPGVNKKALANKLVETSSKAT